MPEELDFEAYQIGDGASGAVFAGNPLRIKKGHRAGLRGNGHANVEQAPGSVTGVHLDLGWFLHVLRADAKAAKRIRHASGLGAIEISLRGRFYLGAAPSR